MKLTSAHISLFVKQLKYGCVSSTDERSNIIIAFFNGLTRHITVWVWKTGSYTAISNCWREVKAIMSKYWPRQGATVVRNDPTVILWNQFEFLPRLYTSYFVLHICGLHSQLSQENCAYDATFNPTDFELARSQFPCDRFLCWLILLALSIILCPKTWDRITVQRRFHNVRHAMLCE